MEKKGLSLADIVSVEELVSTLKDKIADENDILDTIVFEEQIKTCLSSLSKRELEVIVLRYGLCGLEPMTLEAIGKLFGITRERVRQTEAKALIKLRRKTLCRKNLLSKL